MATTVLVAVDFEEASRRAIEVAREFARLLGASLCLVHVYALPVYPYPGLAPPLDPSYGRAITLAAGNSLDQLAAEVGAARALLREGDVVTEILAAARELDATLIVMGTHGRRGLSHVLLGSVAEKVVRRSEIPVLTVRADGGAAPGPAARGGEG